MNNPLVSIIIPTYNYASFIAETIQCLIDQEYDNWEAIVVDDGSTDQTGLVVGALVKKDDRVKYFFQENAGLSAARNTGVGFAKGIYYQFLDADDLLSKAKIKQQVDHLRARPDIDISYTNAFYFKSSNLGVLYKDLQMSDKEWMPKLNGGGYTVIARLIRENIMPVNSALVRKEVLDLTGAFDEKLKSLEDWDYWVRCAFRNFSFAHLEHTDAFALIRVHAQSMSKNKVNMFLADAQMRSKLVAEISEADLPPDQKKKLLSENSGVEKYIYIELIKTVGLINFKKLKPIIKVAGIKIFIKYYLKTLTRSWKKR